jgi:hypothetical protein
MRLDGSLAGGLVHTFWPGCPSVSSTLRPSGLGTPQLAKASLCSRGPRTRPFGGSSASGHAAQARDPSRLTRVAQPHVPFTQPCAGWHCFPQPPQFRGSVRTSTHWPPQRFVSLLHEHAPFVQAVEGPHATLQSPQCAGSPARSTQKPVEPLPHTVWPGGHVQRLDAQRWPAAQAVLQPPQ